MVVLSPLLPIQSAYDDELLACNLQLAYGLGPTACSEEKWRTLSSRYLETGTSFSMFKE
jgi:hypothetical protein